VYPWILARARQAAAASMEHFCQFCLPRKTRAQYLTDFDNLTIQSATLGLLTLDDWIADGLQRFSMDSSALSACFLTMAAAHSNHLTRSLPLLPRALTLTGWYLTARCVVESTTRSYEHC
jgi:hypothetical protein